MTEHDNTAELAYQLWQAQGPPHYPTAVADWLRAEQMRAQIRYMAYQAWDGGSTDTLANWCHAEAEVMQEAFE